MDIPQQQSSPAPLHRHPSTASSSYSSSALAVHRPSHSRDATDPDLPTRFRRGSTASTSTGLAGLSREEIDERERLVNEYEAEEERLMREETTHMHNAMEGEAEALVNKLQRQLSSLQAQLAAHSPSTSPALATATAAPVSPLPPHGLPSIGSPVLPAGSFSGLIGGGDPMQPSQDKVIEMLRLENDGLRTRLSDAERGFIHVCRQNDVYREELITLRQRLNLPYQDLVLPPPSSPSPSPSFNGGHSARYFGASGASSRSPGLGSSGGRSFTRAGGHRPSASGSSFSTDPNNGGSALADISSSSSSSSALPSPAISLGAPVGGGDQHAHGSASPEVERRLSLGGQDRPSYRVAERGQLKRVGSGASAGQSQEGA